MPAPRHTSRAAVRSKTTTRVIAAALLVACSTSAADDAPADGAAATNEPAGGAITLWTDSTELFMEHPALIVGAPDKFAVHLTDITDFAPLRSGRITLTFERRDGGEPMVVVQDAPRSPGIYGPAPIFKRAGTYDLTIFVDSPQAKDEIRVPGLVVYGSASAAPRETGAEDAGIAFLKEQQWKTDGFRTEAATEGHVLVSFEASGVLEPAAGRFAHVTAPVAGLIDASSLAAAPVPGARVTTGQVVARLVPSLGDGGGADYAEARARLREAEDEVARAKRLIAVEAIPERRVHEAENRLTAAREALAGYAGGALDASGRIAVRAPVSGVIAERTVTPGSRVEAGTALFTIVDPSVVWLRVNVPAAQSARVSRGTSAEFSVDGSDRRFATRRTVSTGSIIDSMSRTLPLLFEVGNPDGTLKVGATAKVTVATGARETGVTIPYSAVLDEDGRAIAYVQPEGERFEKRTLTLGGRQGDRVIVRSGLKAGEHVVSGAAYQVRLASLSTSVPAHGHEH